MEGHSWRFWICSRRRRKEKEKESSSRGNRKYSVTWQNGPRSSFFKVSNVECWCSELCPYLAQGRMVIEGLSGLWFVSWYSDVGLLLYLDTHILLWVFLCGCSQQEWKAIEKLTSHRERERERGTGGWRAPCSSMTQCPCSAVCEMCEKKAPIYYCVLD